MKTILVPVDLSAATTRVCDAACVLAKLIKARVLLLHVVQPPPVIMNDYYALDAGLMTEVIDTGEKYATRRLAALVERCRGKRLTVRSVQLSGLQPAAEILAQAQSVKAAYIVLGSHGHGAMYDLLAGSTAKGVLRKASCPVLVVPMTRG